MPRFTEDLLAALGLGDLVPESLSAWRPLVIAGVRYFLEHLPPARQSELIEEQLTLPADALPAARLVAVLRRCPTLHKLGQVIARQRGLPAALRAQLQTLESLPPATPIATLTQEIRRELQLGGYAVPLELAASALAEGSVAAVVPFQWQAEGTTQQGVFKVLKPGARERMEEELALWLDLGDFLQERARALDLPALEFRATLESVRALLASEVRLDGEQTHLAAAAAFYINEPRIVIPPLLPWCTPRMTAMGRITGQPVTTAELRPTERRRLATTLTAALLALPFWTQGHATFHADPHAGNLFITDDQRLAVLDWSLTARLTKEQREAMVDAALGGLSFNLDKICTAVAALGTLRPQDETLRDAAARALQRVRAGTLPGMSWFIALMDDIAARTDAGFRDDLVLFRKSRLTLAAVIADVLDPAGAHPEGSVARLHDPDDMLITVALQRFFAELPARLTAPYDSRYFDSHLSNANLVELWLSLGGLPARYWRGVVT